MQDVDWYIVPFYGRGDPVLREHKIAEYLRNRIGQDIHYIFQHKRHLPPQTITITKERIIGLAHEFNIGLRYIVKIVNS